MVNRRTKIQKGYTVVNKKPLAKAIAWAGSRTKLAKILGVSASTVSNWQRLPDCSHSIELAIEIKKISLKRPQEKAAPKAKVKEVKNQALQAALSITNSQKNTETMVNLLYNEVKGLKIVISNLLKELE